VHYLREKREENTRELSPVGPGDAFQCRDRGALNLGNVRQTLNRPRFWWSRISYDTVSLGAGKRVDRGMEWCLRTDDVLRFASVILRGLKEFTAPFAV